MAGAKQQRAAGLIVLCIAGVLACARAESLKILWVGNSFTFYHGGAETMTHDIGASLSPPEDITGDRLTGNGYPLDAWLGYQYAPKDIMIEKLNQDDWDIVMLQELHSKPRQKFNEFRESVLAWDKNIKALTNAETWFFMPWVEYDSMYFTYSGRGDSTGIQIQQAAYERVAAEISATIIPVGLAWDRVRRERPDIRLWDGVGMSTSCQCHATRPGGFLNACTWLAGLTGRDPRTTNWILDYATVLLDSADIPYIRTVAWETIQNYNDGLVARRRIDYRVRPSSSPSANGTLLRIYDLRGMFLGNSSNVQRRLSLCGQAAAGPRIMQTAGNDRNRAAMLLLITR
jgi:hypothetical protein